jgi:hypothetical protein|tara:strand:- start:7599 stop:7823 length:225 start_codon:yes stop_codon:yes gene_type:complete
MDEKGKARILDFYFTEQQPVHIKCVDARFFNGKVLEINFDRKFVNFIDDKLGEVIIPFEDIYSIKPFREKGFGV